MVVFQDPHKLADDVSANPEIREEKEAYPENEQWAQYESMPTLTTEQDKVFEDVISCVFGMNTNSSINVFYVDGPAGSGKTFLYSTLLRYLRGHGLIVVVVAMSGIAALLLEGGIKGQGYIPGYLTQCFFFKASFNL